MKSPGLTIGRQVMQQQEPGLVGLVGPTELVKRCGLLSPTELIKQFPGEPLAVSDRRGWVGLEALRYRYQPPNGALQPPLTHHSLLLFLRTPKEFEARFDGISRVVPPPAGSILLVPAGSSAWWRWSDHSDSLHVFLEPGLVARVAVDEFELDPARVSLPPLDGLGSTEALHIFLSNRPRQVRPGSLGTPVPGYEVQLRDDSGRIVDSAGQMGTLYVKGGSIASGYWRRPEAAGQVFQGDWLCVGDAFVRNADDTYSWLGRSGDLIKVGGIWLAPGEIEECLLQNPAVAQAAVVAAADEYGMQKPVACVVLRPGHVADSAALISWCRNGLAAFKRPRAVVLMAELPTTSSGKLRRGVLRRQVAHVLLNPPQGNENESAAIEVNRAQ